MAARARPFPTVSRRSFAAWSALAAACGVIACADAGSAAGPQPAAESEPAHALKEGAARVPGVPPGCTREWDYATADSVLNCPDVRPPSPD